MDILDETLKALSAEERVVLCTIIATSGSTPASAFSKMLVKNHGTTSIGTVGGGCLEGDVAQAAKRLYEANRAEILTFHLNEDEFVQGLICGGSLEVLIEPVTRDYTALFRDLVQRRDEGEDSVLATLLTADGQVLLRQIIQSESGILKSHIPVEHNVTMIEELHKVFHRNQTRRVKVSNGELILEHIAGTPEVIIFGGGHVSKYISKTAVMAGFRVSVVDDRKQYANPERFPEASQTLATDFDEAFNKLQVKSSTYMVIVTRGHQYDEHVLEQALKTPAKYIGMIGSKRKVLKTYEHLTQRGASSDTLQRVHAPMGIEIGATSAEEIGISIVAQLIAVRRGEKSPYADKSEKIHQLLFTAENIHPNQ